MKGGDTIPYHAMRGEVAFKNVTFTYPSRPEQACYTHLLIYIYFIGRQHEKHVYAKGYKKQLIEQFTKHTYKTLCLKKVLIGSITCDNFIISLVQFQTLCKILKAIATCV